MSISSYVHGRRHIGIVGNMMAMLAAVGLRNRASRERSVGSLSPATMPAARERRKRPEPCFLRQRIQTAPSDANIRALLAEGASFRHAADDTRRKWQKDAARRRAVLAQA